MEVLVIASRYLHVLAAIVAVGGAIFIRFVLPAGLAQAEPMSRDAVFLRCRKIFKIMVHASVTFLLLSGAFNTWRNWEGYKLTRGVMHALWGSHVVLGLAVVGISLMLLGPAQPRASHKGWMKFNVFLMLAVVLLASTLNFFRTKAIKERMVPPTTELPVKPTAVVGL